MVLLCQHPRPNQTIQCHEHLLKDCSVPDTVCWRMNWMERFQKRWKRWQRLGRWLCRRMLQWWWGKRTGAEWAKCLGASEWKAWRAVAVCLLLNHGLVPERHPQPVGSTGLCRRKKRGSQSFLRIWLLLPLIATSTVTVPLWPKSQHADSASWSQEEESGQCYWGSSSLSGCGIRRERWDTVSASVPSAPEKATAESAANDCESSGKSET